MQIIIAHPNAIDNLCPALEKILPTSPSHFAIASIASNDKPTSANINPVNPFNQLLPVISPKNGGNNKFPAPKNIANNANPTIMISLFVFFIVTSLFPFLFCFIYVLYTRYV